MKNLLLSISSLVFLYGCGGGSDTSETQFYKTQKTTPQTLDVSIEASGAIEAISSVEIKSKASGEVLFLGAEVGDSVNKGSTLAQIDQRTANNIVDQTLSDLEAAKVRLVNAESQYERGKELHKNSSISDKDFEDIKENYAQAKSTVVRTEVSFENAKISLDDTLVKSPISGTIISRPVEVGQVISSPTSAFGEGSILMTMADLSKVRVRALVDEIDVGKVRLGQSVSIKVAAYRDKEFIGTVTKIEPKAYIQQNVTTFPVLIDIDNKENLLLIGMNTDVVIQILNKDVSLSVPTMSLRTRKDIYTAAAVLDIKTESIDEFLKNNVDGENFNRFIIIKDSKKGPNLQWVKVGVSDLYNVEIIEGLEIGDVVYILPSKSLFDYQERFKKRVEGSFSFG
ncbi:MAG: efflux RND transporter periplasmic adaptor subunit [SAR86 cluster bacterium]|jgi:HlyD family secretion protein|nr:MAG: efflux RND transporter periplasmic adaptor subunit [SAR86 cluster bacterium]URQ69059.1 efflux RND transporter periplasmic adaptor subunit [SAR86 cluster bacterium]|tara:strand:- start:479 stop:1669 length:1191 start_codon:yes stop_codon:yes gene_type:complete